MGVDMMDIALTSLSKSSSQLLTDVDMALLRKTLDMARVEGAAMEEMMEAVPPSLHALDVYA